MTKHLEHGQKKLSLLLRIYARQWQDVSHKFSEVEGDLLKKHPVFTADPVSEFTRPCFFDEIEAAQQKGLLLTQWSGGHFYIIREQRFNAICENPEELLKEVEAEFPGTFSAAEIFIEYRSELVAL